MNGGNIGELWETKNQVVDANVRTGKTSKLVFALNSEPCLLSPLVVSRIFRVRTSLYALLVSRLWTFCEFPMAFAMQLSPQSRSEANLAHDPQTTRE